MKIQLSIWVLALLGFVSVSNGQATAPIIVNTNEVISEIQPRMWGVFFEDINMGADGGIYAELVKNRSFEFSKPLMGWETKQNFSDESTFLIINRQDTQTNNHRFLRVAKKAANTIMSLTNEGFRGIGIRKGITYNFSLMYRQSAGGMNVSLELLNDTGVIIGTAVIKTPVSGEGWQKTVVSFNTTEAAGKGRLKLVFTGTGSIDLDMISLFPSDTWKGRPGGMRADMVQLLADMQPGFIRFPGGCIVEGTELDKRYQWKKTIGPVEERQLLVNRWSSEFAGKAAPDYYQSFGLGFFEYFQLAEDIGAAPLPILNCGMACQFNSAEVVSMDKLDPYVQDALDLVEFANGDTLTFWGKKRAEMGHAAPFHLTMMGVGNENWGPQYLERLEVFTKAIKSKYPEISIINSSGTDPNGPRFDLLNNKLRENDADFIDEHFYRNPAWFLANAGRYDNYPRTGSKVFCGEYAAHSTLVQSGPTKNNWQAAIAEAAFMTGLERNAAVVQMASYAPLFAHIDAWQWAPDLIWVDNLRSYGTPSYYVQKLFSTNRGTHTIPALLNNAPLEGKDSLYVSAVLDKRKKELILKIVNIAGIAQNKPIIFEGAGVLQKNISITTLRGDEPSNANSFDSPDILVPKETKATMSGKNKLYFTAAPNSLSVVRVQIK